MTRLAVVAVLTAALSLPFPAAARPVADVSLYHGPVLAAWFAGASVSAEVAR